MKSYIIEALESIIGENGSYKDLGDAKIVDKSWDTEGTQFNIKGFQACAFEFNGEINVCFRGTPDGAWIDNGYGNGRWRLSDPHMKMRAGSFKSWSLTYAA